MVEEAPVPESTREGSASRCADDELAKKAAAQRRLNRGRLLTLAGVIILSFDTPTFRFVRTQSPASNALGQGLAATVWRGFCYCIASAVVLCLESSSLSAFREAVRALGWRRLLFCAVMLGGANTCFPCAVALTTATNVLVIVAMMPLACALMSRACGIRLPLHTWAAALVACVSVALCFASSVQAGGDQVLGCVLAVGAMSMFGAFITMGSLSGAVSCVAAMPLAGVLCIGIAFAGLGPRWHYATPASPGDGGFLMLNGMCNAVANAMLVVGTQSVPAAEISLIQLLETALGPVLTYLVTLHRAEGPEVPDTKSIAAGAIIVAVLLVHTLWDVRLAMRAHKELAPAESAEQAATEPTADAEHDCVSVE